MLHDTRLVQAIMDDRAAAAPAALAQGRASPMRLRLARWLVRTGTRLQGERAVESRLVVLDPCVEVAPEMPRAA